MPARARPDVPPPQGWELVVFSLIGWFAISTVVQLAVAKQLEMDEETVAKRSAGKKQQ